MPPSSSGPWPSPEYRMALNSTTWRISQVRGSRPLFKTRFVSLWYLPHILLITHTLSDTQLFLSLPLCSVHTLTRHPVLVLPFPRTLSTPLKRRETQTDQVNTEPAKSSFLALPNHHSWFSLCSLQTTLPRLEVFLSQSKSWMWMTMLQSSPGSTKPLSVRTPNQGR